MKVLVTGANGFIGRALCERLLAEGWQVRGAVRSKVSGVVLPAGIEADTYLTPIGSFLFRRLRRLHGLRNDG
jgi:uncharacterized protein YbjT (DUF2867 family)